MNLAVHGLEGQVSQSNTYYENPFDAVGAVRLRHGESAVQRQQDRQAAAGGRQALPVRPAASRQRQLHLDPGLLLGAEPQGPCRLRHGELRRRRRRVRARDPPQAHRGSARRRHRRGGLQLLLHGDAAGDACGSSTRASAGPSARTRCSSSTRARSSARSTVPTATGGRSRSSFSPTSRGCTAARPSRRAQGSAELMAEIFPDGRLCRRARALSRSRRSSEIEKQGLEPEPRAIRRRRGGRG